MREDNETLLRRLINGAASVLGGKTAVQIRCVDCNEWKREGDSSPCGSHLPLPDRDEDTFLVRIGFVKPKPVERELPPPVKRLDGKPSTRLSNAKQRDEKWKRPEGQELTAQRLEPRRRTDGGATRADRMGTLSGNPDEWHQKMVRKLHDPEPSSGQTETGKWGDIPDDLPIYGLEER